MDMGDYRAAIKAARERAGLTQEELARKVGCSSSTVRNWERGDTRPRSPALMAIAQATGVPVETLAASGATERSVSFLAGAPTDARVADLEGRLAAVAELAEEVGRLGAIVDRLAAELRAHGIDLKLPAPHRKSP